MPAGFAERGGGIGWLMIREFFFWYACALVYFLLFRFRNEWKCVSGVDHWYWSNGWSQISWIILDNLAGSRWIELNDARCWWIEPLKWFLDGSGISFMQWSSSVLECWKWIPLGQLHQGQQITSTSLESIHVLLKFGDAMGCFNGRQKCSCFVRADWGLHIVGLPCRFWEAAYRQSCEERFLEGEVSCRQQSFLVGVRLYCVRQRFLKWVTERLVHYFGTVWFCYCKFGVMQEETCLVVPCVSCTSIPWTFSTLACLARCFQGLQSYEQVTNSLIFRRCFRSGALALNFKCGLLQLADIMMIHYDLIHAYSVQREVGYA